jgi:hypothetical protein
MQSPRAEYLLFGAGFAAFDYMRARGEADGDTLSEVTRDLVARHPHGPAIFTVLLFGACAGFRRHILGPLREAS